MDKFPSDRSESLTAEGVTIRILTGEVPRKSEMIQKGMDLCLKTLPVWDEQAGTIDFSYWFWGTQASFQVGGDVWKRWNAAMRPALVDNQRKDGDEKGSWDPISVWGRDGGRIYSTALSTMILQAYYRTGRIGG